MTLTEAIELMKVPENYEKVCEHGKVLGWLRELKERRTTDVQPVKRGKWIFTEKLILGNPYGSYKCSECMYHVPHEDNYCPNCGADMREKEREQNDT